MRKFIPLIIITVVLLNSCNKLNKDKISEGIIEYNINYLNEEQETLYSFLLPKKMTIKFKDNKTKTELVGFSGNFYFSIITNTETDSAIALIKIMNQNYYYIDNTKGPSDLFGEIPGIEIDFTDDTCSIGGISGEIAKVNSQHNNFSSFDVVYTDKIQIRNPNKKNPFSDIKGVLLDFRLNLYNMDMRFIVDRVIDSSISNKEFSIPKEFKRIRKEDVNQILSLIE